MRCAAATWQRAWRARPQQLQGEAAAPRGDGRRPRRCAGGGAARPRHPDAARPQAARAAGLRSRRDLPLHQPGRCSTRATSASRASSTRRWRAATRAPSSCTARCARSRRRCCARPDITAKAVFKFFRAASEGETLHILTPDGARVLESFHFGRQTVNDGLCLADYTLPLGVGRARLRRHVRHHGRPGRARAGRASGRTTASTCARTSCRSSRSRAPRPSPSCCTRRSAPCGASPTRRARRSRICSRSATAACASRSATRPVRASRTRRSSSACSTSRSTSAST